MKNYSWILLLPMVLALAGCPKSPSSSNGPTGLIVNTFNGSSVTDVPTTSGYGFYIQPYPGTSLSSVILWITGSSASITLTATDITNNSSNLIASVGPVSFPGGGSFSPVTFTFNGNPGVAKGDKICFSFSASTSGGADNFCLQSSTTSNVNFYITSGSNCSSVIYTTWPAIALFGNS